MAKNMPTASNGRQVARPAQGDNKGPLNRPRPAYSPDAAPVVVSTGSASRPTGANSGGRFRGKRLTGDATPKVVQL